MSTTSARWWPSRAAESPVARRAGAARAFRRVGVRTRAAGPLEIPAPGADDRGTLRGGPYAVVVVQGSAHDEREAEAMSGQRHVRREVRPLREADRLR